MISRQTLQAPDHDFPEGPRWGRGGDAEEPLGAVRNPSGTAAVEPEGDADGKLIRSPLIVMETYLSKYPGIMDLSE
jgi:hypothetical protein